MEQGQEDQRTREGGKLLEQSKKDQGQSPKYILYVLPNDANSQRAIRCAPDAIHVVDVSQLPEIPHWVRGVPTAVDVSTGRVFEGTNCLGILTAQEAAWDTRHCR